MQIEFTIDRSGLWFSGLGVSAHVAAEDRAVGEAWASMTRQAPRSRTVRLGRLLGVVSRR